MTAQLGCGHIFVLVYRLPQCPAVVGSFGAGQSGNDGLLQFIAAALRHRLETSSRCCSPFFRVISFGAHTLQNEYVVRGEITHVEAQGISGAGQLPAQVGAGPVDDRHEVVANDLYASLYDGRQRVFPGVRELPKRTALQLNGIVNGNTFDHRPSQSRRLDLRLALEHFVERPGFPAVEMMQCRNNSGCSRLPDMVERNWVLRAKPPPGFFHAAILNLG